MSETIKHINLCITKEELAEYLYEVYKREYAELERNKDRTEFLHKSAKSRMIFYTAFFIFHFIMSLPDISNWEIVSGALFLLSICLTYKTYKRTKNPPVVPELFVPEPDFLKNLSLEEVLDSHVMVDESSPYCCARALLTHALDTVKIMCNGKVCVTRQDGLCTYIIPLRISDDNVDAITINSSGAFFGNQETVAKSAIIETFDVNIKFERN